MTERLTKAIVLAKADGPWYGRVKELLDALDAETEEASEAVRLASFVATR